jgi:DNA-binding ferritin-like protein (Dps family)
LKEKIRQLETKTPEYKELEDRLEIARLNALTAQQYEREMKSALYHKQTIADWFDVLKRSEVMVLTPEGMKYLVGQDLEDFCKAEIEKQAQARTTMWDFKSFANQAINTIIRDEIDKAPLNQYQLDAYKYITKGRYDTGTKE